MTKKIPKIPFYAQVGVARVAGQWFVLCGDVWVEETPEELGRRVAAEYTRLELEWERGDSVSAITFTSVAPLDITEWKPAWIK